jgi:hypothetical protein
MIDSRLKTLVYLFPAKQTEELEFFESLTSLVGQDPFSQSAPEQVTLTPSSSPAALPATRLALSQIDYPEVLFETNKEICVRVGNLQLRSSTASALAMQPTGSVPTAPPSPRLAHEELQHKFKGRILRLDHSGVEFPSAMLERPAWDRLLQDLATVCNLYAYPTGEDFPFVLPADEGEFLGEIERFTTARGPKFELTYGYTQFPTLQFAFDTGLSRTEAETLLPEPVGFTLPGVDSFRSTLLTHPWPGLEIRLDFNFQVDGQPNAWDTGEWIVKQGRRM